MMWEISPTYAVITAFLSWMVLCWVRIWFSGPGPNSPGPVRALLSLVARRLFATLYGFVGLYLLDIAARISFLDLISYGHFRCVAAPVVLCCVLGLVYVVRCALAAPTWTTLPAFSIMAGTYLYLTTMVPQPQLRVAFWIGTGLTVAFSLLEMPVTRVLRRGRDGAAARATAKPAPLWDFSRQFDLMTGPGTHAAVLALLSVELVLQFEGRSLLCWP